MEKVYGSPIRQDGLMKVGRTRWDLFYGFGKDDGKEIGWNWRKTFDHQPTLDEMKDTILTQINSNVQKAILEGYEWNGHQVWLSDENQRNYMLAYSLVKDGTMKAMPQVKFGTEDKPLLYTFADADELTSFTLGMQEHIQGCLESAWKEKEDIDWSSFC